MNKSQGRLQCTTAISLWGNACLLKSCLIVKGLLHLPMLFIIQTNVDLFLKAS